MSADNNEEKGDWLEGDIEGNKEQQRAKALEVAQLYLVFVDTPRARQLLEDWEKRLVDVQTPVESSIQRYAADESVRDFVRGIRRQIKLAQEFME